MSKKREPTALAAGDEGTNVDAERPEASAFGSDKTTKWTTTGLRQANTMGGGEGAIPKSGKFRVFVLMGQSNMQGAARAAELKAPYTEKHERIRIWANGRWEYFVPRNRFGRTWARSSWLTTERAERSPTQRQSITACCPSETTASTSTPRVR
jgi:hypothetical protein